MEKYQLLFKRLEPRTTWKGGRITHTDLLTLHEATKEASLHAGTQITTGDFLRAAARGEILLRAIVRTSAKVEKHDGGIFCNHGEPTENIVPQSAIPTLPLEACSQLANTGHASWRTFDGFETEEGFTYRFTIAKLNDSEPDFETVADDCRISGMDVHALADAFIDDIGNTDAAIANGMRPSQVAPKDCTKEESITHEIADAVGWWNATMNAAMWFKLASVKPDEAAILLCRIDPLERDWQSKATDPEHTYADGDNAWPDRYQLLKRTFEDVAEADPRPRTLHDWRDEANHQGLRYHQWIDDYVQATSYGESATTKVGTGGTEKAASLQDVIAQDWPIRETGKFSQASFRNALSDVPNWLEPAIVMRGRPGKSSNLWNPAMIAYCLMAKGVTNKGALTSHIRNYFPDWLPEWEEKKEQ